MSLLQYLRQHHMGNFSFPYHHVTDCFCSTSNNKTALQRKRRRRKLPQRIHHHWSWLLRRLLQQMLLLPLLVLVLLCSPASAITLPVAMPPSHPKHFLTVAGQELDSQSTTSLVEAVTSNRVPVGLEEQVVREDEVMYHFYKNGRLGANYRRKASTVFMVQLFNDLLRGLAPTRKQRTEKPASASRGDTATSKEATEPEEDVPFTDTIRSFSAEVRYSKKKRATISFFIPLLPPNERLRSAEIRFLRNPSSRKRKNKKRIKLRIDVLRGGRKVEKVVLRERPVAQQDYFVFDVSRALDSWINSYHGNISLKIRVPKKLEKTILLSDASLKSTSLIALYLEDREFLKNMYESYTTEEASINENPDTSSSNSGGGGADQSRSRSKRDTNSRGNSKRRRQRNRKNKRWYRAPKHEKCQMYDFEVDFDFIGWGQWIIHPKHFNARFCYGECPSPVDTKYKPTNHAMLQTLMRQKRPRLAPPACCVPIRLKPLSMLYFEYDEIVVRHHENMIADECGCR